MRTEDRFEIPELEVIGRFTCLAAPVQAEGSVASSAFFFRARHEGWSFAVAPSPSVDPADIRHPTQGFLREGIYGSTRSEASWMTLADARDIIERCAREFLHQLPPGPPAGSAG